MLEGIRRYQYSWGTVIGVSVIGFFLTFWGLGSGYFAQVRPVASVNGQRILAEQVDHEADRLRQTLQQVYGANAQAMLKSINLRQTALDQLIEKQLVDEEARHLGIHISNQALEAKIEATPSFQRDGQFDFDGYQEILRSNGMLPHEYEAGVRNEMIANTLRSMIDAGVLVSDDEARQAYNLRNERIGLRYIEVAYSDLTAKIAPTGQQIADYYKQNSDEFREPERVKIVFIHYTPLVLASTYTPSDKEIESYYYRNLKTRFAHPDQVRTQHVLIEVPAGATEAEKNNARAKAQDVLKQAQSGADFGKLAAKYSDDPGSRASGGEYTFGRGEMVKPFDDAAFSMKPGEIRLIETRFGFHVLKLNESKPAHSETIAEARGKVVDELRTQAGSRLGREALDKDLTAALAGANLPELAKKRGLDAVETPLFAEDESVKGAEGDRELVTSAFKLDPGQVRAVPAKGGGPYLIKLVEKQPSRILPLAEIGAKVRDAYIRRTVQADARAQAQKILTAINSAADFDKAAAQYKLPIKSVEPFPRADHNVPGIGQFPEVTDAASLVPMVPGVIARVMENGGNSYIFEVSSRTEPSDEEWKSAQKGFVEEFLAQRRAQAWTRFLDQLKDQAKIKIDTDQLGASESSM